MTWAKFILVALQLIQSWVRWCEENRLLDEGERRGLLKALLASAETLKLADGWRSEVARLNADEQKALSEGFWRD